MKKILLIIIGLALAMPAWAAQTAVTQISGTQASIGALKTQVNAKLGTVESNRQDHETRVAAMETGKETKAVVQASAPADTTIDWYDTDQEVGVYVHKKHNGTTWVRVGSHGVQYASSCASITAGMCVDTDDGKLYYHNNTEVVEVGSGGSVDLSAYLSKTNTTAFTPTGDWHPATKKYVDDSITAGGGAAAINDLTDVDTTGKATGKVLKFDASGNLVVGDDSTGSGSVPDGTVNGQVLLWLTDQWAASTPPWVTTASLGTGVATALAAAVDGTGGLASKAAIDALLSISAGTGITITEDGGGAGIDTIEVTANVYQAYDAHMIAWPSAISAIEVGYLDGLSEALSTSLAAKKSIADERKEIGWMIRDSDVVTAVVDGKQAAVIPANMNGMMLIDLICSVSALNSAASGETTVVLRRVRGATAVDMTSTGVTIAYTDYTALDEVVDTANDDVATGDKIFVDVTTVTSPAQKGLGCTAIFVNP